MSTAWTVSIPGRWRVSTSTAGVSEQGAPARYQGDKVMNRSGSCQCGQVRYEIEGEDLGLAICYCTECQKMSTGIATYSLGVPRSAFRLTSGSLKQWTRMADSGARNTAHFCPECGVRIFHENPDAPDHIRVKAGTLDGANKLVPDVHVWTCSAAVWIKIPEGALSYEKQGNLTEIVTAVKARRGAHTEKS